MNLNHTKIIKSSPGVIVIKYDNQKAKLTETTLINIVKLNMISKRGLPEFKANDRILNFLLRSHSSRAHI